jgi:hypothetical protein
MFYLLFVIAIYLRILVSNKISISDNFRVVLTVTQRMLLVEWLVFCVM